MYKCVLVFLIFALIGCVSAEDKIKLKSGDRDLLVYNAAYIPSPVKEKPFYGRSGFIHPVYSPSGKVLTEPFPADHRHQHAVMFAWTSSVIDGRKTDFWNSHRKQGKIEHVETVKADENTIIVKLRHIDLKAKPAATVINETWEITRVPHETLNIFDLKSTHNAVKKFKIGKYHYGALCLRGHDNWKGDQIKVSTSEGDDREKGNHTKPKWVTMNGVVDGDWCGIAAMGHPSNFRFPQPVRIHPKMPYFCFAPMVDGDFYLEPGKPYVSKFRFVAYDGKANADVLNKIFEQYSNK